MAPSETGPIPFDRHQAILNTERTRASEAEGRLSRLQWAEHLASQGKTAEQIQESLALYDGIDGDPVGFLERFHANLENHPTFASQVRSWAGRVLNGRRGGSQVDPGNDPEPQADMQDSNGVPVFSAPRMQKWQEWRERQFEARLNERLNPLVNAHEQAAVQEQDRRLLQQAVGQQRQILQELRNDPVFKENESLVRDYMKSKNFTNVTLHEAYAHILSTKVIPSLRVNGQAQAEAAMRTQAAASGLKPSTTAPVMPGAKPKSFHDERFQW
jgi:hypothetical protein